MMAKYACPVCGDPNAFPIWIDDEPPAGCPRDDAWLMHGKAPQIRNITECAWQMKKAWQAAEFRKLVPDAFDESGKMKNGQLGRVLAAFHEEHPTARLAL